MTETELAKKLFDRWHIRLGLGHWFIDLSWIPVRDADGDENSLGLCLVTPGMWRAKIRIREGQAFAELRNTIVHELVHLLNAGTRMAVDGLRKADVLTSKEWEIFNEQFSRAFELDTDATTSALCAAPGWDDADLAPPPKESTDEQRAAE